MTIKARTLILVLLMSSSLFAACNSQPKNATDLLAMKEWDLLWISDSSGRTVADIYADYIREDTAITVTVHDKWRDALSAGTVLEILEGGAVPKALEEIPELIPEMEVIVVYGNPEESEIENNPWDWNCGQSAAKTYVNACDMDTFARYIQDLEQIYQHIFELAGDKAVIVRAIDAYNPVAARWKTEGTLEECQECWGNYNSAIHQAATAYNVPIARVYDAWNGPDHDEDPNDKGYTRDGINPSETGARVVAEELRKLGYEPIDR